MEDRAYMMVYYWDGKFFWIFRHCAGFVPEIPSPKHHEIYEFGRNYHISAMKFSNFTHITALLQVHYNISFEVMSQRFINDNILVEQGCASIKKANILLIFIAEIL
jgi:hypothetical protein